MDLVMLKKKRKKVYFWNQSKCKLYIIYNKNKQDFDIDTEKEWNYFLYWAKLAMQELLLINVTEKKIYFVLFLIMEMDINSPSESTIRRISLTEMSKLIKYLMGQNKVRQNWLDFEQVTKILSMTPVSRTR